MATWICKNCETKNDEENKICSTCGARRNAQSVESCDSGVSPSGSGNNHKQDFSTPKDPDNKPISDTETHGDALRELISKYDRQKSIFRGLVIASVILQLILFAFSYVKDDSSYTIYKSAMGIHGSIEQICSILLVCITIAPAVAVCVKLNVRKRNLPITISIIVAILTTIYCAVIWFGNDGLAVVIVPLLIILSAWACVIFAVKLVKTMNELDNAMYRPMRF